MIRIVIAAVLLVAFLSAGASAQPKPKEESRAAVQLDVVYGKVGSRELKLDLAKPKTGTGPFPCVVCVHGGGWRMGNKKELRPLIELLASRGYVAATVEYRLAPADVFPAQIDDCKSAVRFLRQSADRYGIDAKRFGAVGFSAGGHLVSLLGLTGLDEKWDPMVAVPGKNALPEPGRKDPPAVQCVVDFFGPTDLPAFGKDESAQRSMIGPVMGGKYSEKPDAHLKASPIHYVRKDAPPFLVLHGDNDWIVPIDQSRRFVARLKESGATAVDLVEVKGGSHGWTGRDAENTTIRMLKFLSEHLQK